MHIHGQCHCGQVQFTALVDPTQVSICHCTDCQTFSGAPFRASVRTPSHQVNLSGEVTEYVKTADSGNARVQGFCGRCGTNLYTTAQQDRSLMGLRLGCVAERDQLVPRQQLWGQSALPWLASLPELPCHTRGPDSDRQPQFP